MFTRDFSFLLPKDLSDAGVCAEVPSSNGARVRAEAVEKLGPLIQFSEISRASANNFDSDSAVAITFPYNLSGLVTSEQKQEEEKKST